MMRPGNLLVVVFGMFVLSACSQDLPQSEIPSVVLNTFNIQFPYAQDVEWEKNGAFYEVEYEIDNKDMEALIGETGILIKYKKEIDFSELPEAIKSSLQDQFSKREIDEIYLLVVEENEYYQVEVEGRLTSSQKVFNENGDEAKDVVYYN